MLKNYTTEISIEKTISEIETILAKHGASHIFKMYDDKGVPIAVAFKSTIKGKEFSFKLPMKEDKIMIIFQNAVRKGELPKKYMNDQEFALAQARRTGWRIIKDWVDSQMALLEINLATLEEIFLPYMFDAKRNMTMFEMLEKTDFNLRLEHKDD